MMVVPYARMEDQLDRLTQLPLWETLTEKANTTQLGVVAKLVGFAGPILDRVIETFPAYTLHNCTHADNVVELMGKLLGKRRDDLTALECAMLILSAYFHDIGMVFKNDERAALTSEPDWKVFLEEEPKAFIQVDRAKKEGVDDPSRDIAEWYCRWRHADRVFGYLAEVRDRLRWGTVNLYEELGNLCRSHNLEPKELKDDDLFPTSFLEKADLRFCGVLLRLADILDFDNTRTPESVYRHLGLAARKDPREDASDVEWLKHLASEGFKFPDPREKDYTLGFVAGPDKPDVEHDVRAFLEVIEGEIEQCRTGILPSCSKKWRDFALPGKINRSNIKGNGYRYGDYRFTLEQDRILELLMGENLYQDPYAFVRELVQNAIDTSRHREFIEHAEGNGDFSTDAIQVSEWYDNEGYQWVRFDDYGMGMDEPIIRDHMLKVASSYYKTARFRADILRAREKSGAGDFLPISRFGIGLLSCFIAGDRVEVSTLHRRPHGKRDKPIRLSLNGSKGFFTLQDEPLVPEPMPARPGGDTHGYRKNFGTAVAVRIDPKKEGNPFDVSKLLEKHVLCPPVPVEVHGERIGGDPAELIDKPWCERVTYTLTPEEMRHFEQFFCRKFDEPWQVELLPVDISKHSLTPELRGQLLIAVVKPTNEWLSFLAELKQLRAFKVSVETTYAFATKSGTFSLNGKNSIDATDCDDASEIDDALAAMNADVENEELYYASGKNLRSTLENISYLLEEPAEFARHHGGNEKVETSLVLTSAFDQWTDDDRNRATRVLDKRTRRVCHNGIIVPLKYGTHFDENVQFLRQDMLQLPGHQSTSWGIIALADSLRPQLSVSRDLLRGLPWSVYSHTALAAARAVSALGKELVVSAPARLFGKVLTGEPLFMKTLLADPLFAPNGPWIDEPIIETDDGHVSLRGLRERLRTDGTVKLTHLWSPVFAFGTHTYNPTTICAAALLQIGVNLQVDEDGWLGTIRATQGDPPPLRAGQELFPPLAFISYSSIDCLGTWGRGNLNIRHPFAGWLIEHASALIERSPAIFNLIRNELFGTISRDAETVDEINSALDRLSRLAPDLAPPPKLRLTPADFGI